MTVKLLEQELRQRLPSPHGVALAIMNAFRREEVSIAEISSLVETDPALTGRLLERANSAAMGGRPVVAVSQAVNRLGLQTVRQLALSFSLIDQYSKGNCAEFDYSRFWSHALLMGAAMKELGSFLRLGSPDELFTCGLLSRVGCLALATAYPQEYGKLLATGSQGSKLLALEREKLNIDHLRLSEALLVQWGIPGTYVEAVLFHEEPTWAQFTQGSRPWLLCQTLYLSWQLADLVLAPKVEPSLRISELTEIASHLGIDATTLGKHVDAAVLEWQTLGEKLKVKSNTVPGFEKMTQDTVQPGQENDSEWLRVLIVEDDPIIRKLLVEWLRDENHHTVRTAVNGSEALAQALDFKPHLVLTCWRMPVMDGVELCQALRSSDWGQNIYVLMLTSADQESELVEAFDAGVDDYLTKPVNKRALSARLQAAWRYIRMRDAWERDHERLTSMAAELALSNRRLQLAALTDPLTELANRRAGLTALSQAWSAATRHGHPLTVISLDIDSFKSINDGHGHAAGDAVLQQVGRCLRAAARKEDTVCRWGGEEFLLISPNVTLSQGIQAAERLRKNIVSLSITVDGKQIPITVSLGLASCENALGSQEQLLADADKALYGAKMGGRNRLAVFKQGKVQTLEPA